MGADSLHHWALPRRRRVPHGAGAVSVAPPEYVILQKLEYFREGGSTKHVIDIRAILETRGDQLDRPALTHWLGRLGLNATWQEIAVPS